MNKQFVLSAILTIGILTAISYYAISSSAPNKLEGPRPINFRKCDPKADYKLEFLKLEVDHDLEPGKPTLMTSTWMPKADGHFEKMVLKAYLKKLKVTTKEDIHPAEFTKGTEFVYKYEITLPSVIPHVFVTMTMSLYADKTNDHELSCVAFDVQM